MENIPSGEAKLKKYRCNKCFECPSCQHTLSSRATTVHIPRETDAKTESTSAAAGTESPAPPETEKSAQKTTPKKMYYLSCLACRWTSRDVGLPDQPNGKIKKNVRPEKQSISINSDYILFQPLAAGQKLNMHTQLGFPNSWNSIKMWS